ncbi:MAG: HEPN domain-containing protein [Nitrosomonadales bacterium]|nr:HEPN domain-containing protein [Nitrosomonadales bacterium]
MNIANEEAAMLYRIASQDRRAFQNLIADSGMDLRIVCFHAQQAVEKLLKAVLVNRGSVFSRTHNLAHLAELLTQADVSLPLPADALARLNPYAVIFRYDDLDIPLIGRDDARQMVDAIFVWAENELQQRKLK